MLVTATADSYPPVLAARIGMGIACAVTTPTAYTWIRDVAPSATATSIYGTGVAVGSAAASLTLLLDTQVGWRSALTVIAATGVGAAVLAAVVLPEDRAVNESATVVSTAEAAPGLWDSVQQAFASERAQWIFLACLFRFSSGLCIGVWSAPFFRAVLSAEDVSQYAVAQAVISAVGASVSGIVGGRIADRLSSSGDGALPIDCRPVATMRMRQSAASNSVYGSPLLDRYWQLRLGILQWKPRRSPLGFP